MKHRKTIIFPVQDYEKKRKVEVDIFGFFFSVHFLKAKLKQMNSNKSNCLYIYLSVVAFKRQW